MTSVTLDAVSLARDGNSIIDALSVTIPSGELLAVIGPSGSGKTSMLRLVAGLDAPNSGDVLYDGDVVTDVPPHQRDVAMVFQDNALVPFKTVRKNVSFPLELHDVDPAEIDDRVTAETRALEIERFLARMPKELGAGHQQMVQAARALVRRPRVLLLDEPLARIDPVRRASMRSELKTLQRGYGVTTVYATNDPMEAMSMGDRLLVLDRGRVRQLASPTEIYDRPVDRFVASFVGTPTMSFLRGNLADGQVRVAGGSIPIPGSQMAGPVTVGVRPHDWEIVDVAGLRGVVVSVENHGDHAFVGVDLSGETVLVRVGEGAPEVGSALEVWTHRCHVFGPDGRAITHRVV